MNSDKKYASRYKISNILSIIAGILWIYIGYKKIFLYSWVNILIALIGIIMIILNFTLLKNNYSR
nr:hypothetical protein [Tissierella sp.]